MPGGIHGDEMGVASVAAGTLVGVAEVVGKWVWLDIQVVYTQHDTLQLVPVHTQAVDSVSVVAAGNSVAVAAGAAR